MLNPFEVDMNFLVNMIHMSSLHSFLFESKSFPSRYPRRFLPDGLSVTTINLPQEEHERIGNPGLDGIQLLVALVSKIS